MITAEETPPSTWNVVASTVIILLLGLASLFFAITVTIDLFYSIVDRPNVFLFNKAGLYFYGVATVLLVLPLVVIYTKVFKLKISKQKEKLLNYILLFGLIITFAAPHLTHYFVNSFSQENSYQVCRDKSDNALYIVTVVYAKDGKCPVEI